MLQFRTDKIEVSYREFRQGKRGRSEMVGLGSTLVKNEPNNVIGRSTRGTKEGTDM